MIGTVSYNQNEILNNIMVLNNIERFCADLTYGNGKFYTEIEKPLFKFDISPQIEGVIKCDSGKTPLPSDSLKSVVFDPPFLTYVRNAREGNGNMIMARRFGGYWKYSELEDHYISTINECYRVLKSKGLLIFKCQDIIHNHTMHSTHINVIKWCEGKFRLKDMFILAAKNRMPIPVKKGDKLKTQKHARIHHSYFLVLEKILCPR